jgi:AraC-like DNA-binding protein
MAEALPRGQTVYRTLGVGGEAGLIGVGLVHKSAGNDGRATRRTHWSAVLCLQGSATFRGGDGRAHAIVPGTVFQRFPRVPHSLDIAAQPRWCECWVALGPPAAEALTAFGLADPSRPVFTLGDPGRIQGAIEALLPRLHGSDAARLPQLAAEVFTLAVSLLSAGPRRDADDPRIAAACRRLGEDPRLELEVLAAEIGLTYERFRKDFRAATGLSPGAYRIQRRIERARSLLLEPGMTVQRAATELGYPDAFTFSAQFRRVVGTSPTAWRGGR